MTTQPRSKTLGIVFPPGVDPHVWGVEYDQGHVPDKWPYGLHRLDEAAYAISGMQGTSLGIRDKVAMVGSLVGGKSIPLRPRRLFDVSVAWDEYTAAKMVAQYPGEAMFSGVIWATDAWLAEGNRLRNAVLKRLLVGLQGLWCLSRPQVEELERHTRSNVPVDFLPFGIDKDFFSLASQPEASRILSLGVDRDRDPETLFAALEKIHRVAPDVEIMVQTNSQQALPAGVTKLDRVPHAALRDLYRTASVVLVPTKHNLHASGMTVALEAGATGRPVVACRTPGMDDYVVDGVTGVLVGVGDSDAMAEATLGILADRSYAAELGREARLHVELRHNSEIMMQALGNIISKRL